MVRDRLLLSISLLLMILPAGAQQPVASPPPSQPPQPAPQPAAKPATKADLVTPQARLVAAKTAYLQKAGGSDIPYNVISSGLEGWGRFTLVNTPEKADIILEIEAPSDSSGVSIGGSSKENGRQDNTTWLTKQTGRTEVKLTVHDAKTSQVLWYSSEQAKSAMKRTSRENNLVEAAERLLTRFHDRIEPPTPPPSNPD